ncbi:HD-GYP domain-containing protein, partial [Agarivorans sp.]|uniref:HD-GYP domain-containing protein n=1 Tax=Agarivorans sp. TaxID=1872412 RepID=UPI003D04E002
FTSLGLITYRNQLVNDLSSNAAKQAAALAATLAVKEQEDQRKLEYFAGLSMVRLGLESGDYTALEELLTKLMLSDRSVVQSRLLDSDGLELFKLVSRGGRPIRLNSFELQNKAHRYYVKELFAAHPSQTYFSQVDLNVDYGVLELPHRPVLRIAKQIIGPKTKQMLGALMFNYDIRQELEHLAAILPEELRLFVVDAKQQFLFHPDSVKRYCAELPCDSYFKESQLLNEAHQRLYFNQHLAALINLDSAARPVHSGSRLLVAYKQDYLPYLTQHLSPTRVLTDSKLWWLILVLSILLSGVACYLHARVSRNLYLQHQQHKTHKLLESLSQLMDNFHQSGQNWSNEHFKRLAYFSRLLAEHMELDEQVVEDIYQFAFLHDIGKFCSISPKGKEGDMLQQQRAEQRSISNGYQLLRNFKLGSVAKNIVVGQHERWDGEGYPKRLVGQAIPIEARIVSLVHHFESLMAQQLDSPQLSFDTCYAIINEQSGKAFDPNLVQAFNALEPELRRAYSETTS